MRAEQLEYRTLPRGQTIPLVVRLCGENVAGACRSSFVVRCELMCSRRISPTGLFVRISGVKVTSDLIVTIWTEEGSPLHVMEHEEAHRAIAQYYYAMMEGIARRVAQPYLRRKAPLSMTKNPEEDLRIVDEWQGELADAILRETQDRADFANKILDTLTHGRPPDALPAAKAAAFAEEAVAYAAEIEADAKKR